MCGTGERKREGHSMVWDVSEPRTIGTFSQRGPTDNYR